MIKACRGKDPFDYSKVIRLLLLPLFMGDLKIELIRLERDLRNRDTEGYNKWKATSETLGEMYRDGSLTEEKVLEDVFDEYGDKGWDLKQYLPKESLSEYIPTTATYREYQATFTKRQTKHGCSGKCGQTSNLSEEAEKAGVGHGRSG